MRKGVRSVSGCLTGRLGCTLGKWSPRRPLTSRAFHLDTHRFHRAPEKSRIHPLHPQAAWAVEQFQHQAEAVWGKNRTNGIVRDKKAIMCHEAS